MTGRTDLEVDLSLDDFQPETINPARKLEGSPKAKAQSRPKAKRTSDPARRAEVKRIKAGAFFPSREANDRDQLNIGVPTELKQRFKELSRRSGLRHYALLEQALDAFEEKNG